MDCGFTWHLNSTILTHWGRVTHICVSKLTIFGSDNGLAPGRRQTIIWTNDGILLIGPLGTNFSEILIEILTFSFKKMRLKVSSAKRRPFCLGLNVLKATDSPFAPPRWQANTCHQSCARGLWKSLGYPGMWKEGDWVVSDRSFHQGAILRN